MTVIKVNFDNLKNLSDSSAATWTGDWTASEIADALKNKNFELNKDAIIFMITGRQMNEYFDLKKDPYDDDVKLFCIDLDDIKNLPDTKDVDGWMRLRSTGCRWFDDIVYNNDYAEHEDEYEAELEEDEIDD